MDEKKLKPSLGASTEAILESISDGVFTVDQDWRITSFNRAAEEITGIAREDAIGCFCSEVFKSSMCETQCALRKTLKTGKSIINKVGYIIDSNGEKIPVSVSSAVLRDESGSIIGGAETFRDLSEVEALRSELKGQCSVGDFVSHSQSMCAVMELASAVSDSSSTVLIEGETGTGKEVLARAIHDMSPRSKEPFIAVNCGALPDTLLESELFGYKIGAFTGAEKDKPGRFSLVGNGTLFLDEIGDVSQALQVRLLRVLQERTFEPLGSTQSEKTGARIIAATHRNLSELIEQETFRQDLYYRIHVIALKIPPLRERKEDIPLLADHFVRKFNQLQGRYVPGIAPEVFAAFMTHDWPGNVRELENLIERAFVLCGNEMISGSHLPPGFVGVLPHTESRSNMDSIKRNSERSAILNTLEKNQFNRAATARELGIHKTTLYRKIRDLGIDLPEKNGRSGE
jgi:PAS domain S-box-containing protein